MSGLAATVGLAGALSSNATDASTEAGRQAAANLAVAAQKDIESQRIAAQLAMAAMGLPAANAGTPKNISEGGALLNTAAAMDAKAAGAAGSPGAGDLSGGGEGGGGGGGGEGGGGSSGGGEPIDGSFMPGVGGSGGTMSRADDVRNRMTWGNLGLPAGSMMLAHHTGGLTPGLSGTAPSVIYELSFYGKYPNPFGGSVMAEETAMQNNQWSPSEDDFDPVGKVATSATGGATKPFSQTIDKLGDIFTGVEYFAPLMKHVAPPNPPFQARVKRLNLLVYADNSVMAFAGTVQTTGGITLGAVSAANMNAGVVNTTLLNKVRTAAANKTAIAKLKKAWDGDAEVFLYSAGGVPGDALCKALARLLGAVVRAFDDKFFVIPEINPQTQMFDRIKVGLGSDFAAAKANAVPDLKSLDGSATRRFTP
jgi:hypothetical protein